MSPVILTLLNAVNLGFVFVGQLSLDSDHRKYSKGHIKWYPKSLKTNTFYPSYAASKAALIIYIFISFSIFVNLHFLGLYDGENKINEVFSFKRSVDSISSVFSSIITVLHPA